MTSRTKPILPEIAGIRHGLGGQSRIALLCSKLEWWRVVVDVAGHTETKKWPL
jgi:hypothetical protein